MISFHNARLLPRAWEGAGPLDKLRVFNPGLIREDDGWLFAYRVVAEPHLARRVALCRLDRDFKVVDGTQTPFSDEVRFPPGVDYTERSTTWFADPRLYGFGGRTFVYWNSGWHEPNNHQFLQEIDPVSRRLIGCARELVLSGDRRKLEKNWMLFAFQHEVYATYSVNPYQVLRLDLTGDGPIECRPTGDPRPNPFGFARANGGLRGGAPPVQVEEYFYSFCHSIENGEDGYRYVTSAFRFMAAPPFQPSDMPVRPLRIDIPTELRRKLPKLNPAVGPVQYPAGAAYSDGKWFVSLGIDDERCGIATLEEDEVLGSLAPIPVGSEG